MPQSTQYNKEDEQLLDREIQQLEMRAKRVCSLSYKHCSARIFVDAFDKWCLLGRNFYLNFCEGPTSTLLKSVYSLEGGERKMSSSVWKYYTLDSLTKCCNIDSVVKTCIYNKLFKYLTDQQITLISTSAASRHLAHILVWVHVFRYSLTVEPYM